MTIIWALLLGACAALQANPVCISEIEKEFASVIHIFDSKPSNYTEMLIYSGFKLNDLGNYNKCNDLEGARYVYIILGANYGYSFCLPKICSKQDIADILSGDPKAKSLLGLDVSAAFPTSLIIFPKDVYDDNCTSLNSSAVIMVTFISVVFAICLIATAVDLLSSKAFLSAISPHNMKQELLLEDQTRPPDPSFPVKILLCFSLYSNLKKLFDSRSAERLGTRDTLDVLNGIRVMSIGWVILGHVTLQYISVIVLSNITDLGDLLKEFNKSIIYGAFFAVDTFFWLSGLLMAYLFLKEIDKPPVIAGMNTIFAYVHRYLRITPLLLFCLLFWWSMQPYLGEGPMWFKYSSINQPCPDYWWTNILYINNFYPDWKGSGCLGVTWYLANDMQFFIVSPLILIVYHISKSAGWGLIALINILSILSSGLIANHFDLVPYIFAPENSNNYFTYYYVKPYARCGPYALGLAVGMILYSFRIYKSTGNVYDQASVYIGKMFGYRYIRYPLAVVGVFLTSFFVFYQYDLYSNPGSNGEYDHWGHDGNVAFIAFWRFGFILGLSLIILPCLLGHFPFITMILGAPVWTPFARLTFAVYLIHYNIIFTIFINQQTQIYFDEYYLVRDTIFVTLISYGIAVPIVLLIESPCLNLEKMLLGMARPKKRIKQVDKETPR